jgi:hypothetical protein
VLSYSWTPTAAADPSDSQLVSMDVYAMPGSFKLLLIQWMYLAATGCKSLVSSEVTKDFIVRELTQE